MTKLKTNRKITAFAGLILIIALVSIGSLPASCERIINPLTGDGAGLTTTVWSDDFNDGNYDGWTVQNGTFSATDSSLRTTAGLVWNVANHASTVAYGTWSFDVYINTTMTDMSISEHLYIFFMGDSLEADQQDCYDIMIWINAQYGTPGLTLWKRIDGEVTDLGSFSYHTGLSGWYHIDVTRHTSGQFYIFVNGSLRIDALDTKHSTSKYFGFVALDGHKLDNINVYDEINVFPKPSNLKFSDDSVTVSCQQNSSDTAVINVQNEGEIAGSATLEVGETPDGISVSLSDTSISDLMVGETKPVIATVETSGTVTPGDYTVDVELYNDSNKLDTVQLAITVTGKETTSTTTDDGTAPGIPILGVVMILGIITAFRRKQR